MPSDQVQRVRRNEEGVSKNLLASVVSLAIGHAVWLCHCFSLGLREVETILAQRGSVVSYESIRAWCKRQRENPSLKRPGCPAAAGGVKVRRFRIFRPV